MQNWFSKNFFSKLYKIILNFYVTSKNLKFKTQVYYFRILKSYGLIQGNNLSNLSKKIKIKNLFNFNSNLFNKEIKVSKFLKKKSKIFIFKFFQGYFKSNNLGYSSI